jgi:hypothetical protein
MADDDQVDEGGAEAAAPKSKRKLIMMGGAVVLVLLLAGGGWFFFMRGHGKEQHAAAPPPKPPVFLDVPEVLVNLSSTPGERVQYLKVKVVLEVKDQPLMAQIAPTMPGNRPLSNVSARTARGRSQRIGRAVSPEGRTDTPCQRGDLSQPGERGSFQGNRHSVTDGI